MIKPLGILATSTCMLLATTQAHALSVSANAGNNAVGIEARQAIMPRVNASLGYLHTDDSGRDAHIYSGALMFAPVLPGTTVELGGRYQYQDTNYGNGGGLGLGGSAFVDTPVPRVSVGGYGFYTPKGLTHGSVNESYEYGVQARARLVSQTYLHGGYRYLRTDFDNRGTRTLDSGMVVGVSIGF